MPQGVDRGVFLDAAGSHGGAKSLCHDTGRDRRCDGSQGLPVFGCGRKEPLGVTMGQPVRAQDRQGALWQGDIAGLASFPIPYVDHHAAVVNVQHLQGNAFAYAQSAGVNRAQASAVPWLAQATQHPMHLFDAKDNGQLLFMGRADKGQKRPRPLQGVLVKELDGDRATVRVLREASFSFLR